MSAVAVVVPHHKSALQPDEELSLRHLTSVLGDKEILWVMPQGCSPPRHGDNCVSLESRHFMDIAAYSRLLLDDQFYARFAAWDHILIYQLDCLVFRDELARWCDRSYDYIGAPLAVPTRNGAPAYVVGNGGFSLRRVGACRDVLRAGAPSLTNALSSMMTAPSQHGLSHLPYPARLVKCLRVLNEVRQGAAWYAARYTQNEDLFWSFRARLFSSAFSKAPAHEAGLFAIETEPEEWYRRNGNTLPFGCHAWAKWNRPFWMRHILPDIAS
jgi:hypothetical protein